MTRVRATVLLAGVIVVLGGCGGGKKTTPNQPSVLDRAIVAAGGEAKLAAIRSVEVRSRGEQLGKGYQAVMQRLLPDRYRHDVDVSDARFVQATDGTDIWATLDDYPVRVTGEEAASLRESWRLTQLSMLLPLKTSPGIVIKNEGREDGSDVLRVTFPTDPKFPTTPKGPYSLVIDSTSSLLRRIEFDAVIFGEARRRETRIELLDYRQIDGIMVPFAARISVDGELEQEEQIETIVINPAIPADRFRRPETPADLVIKERISAEVMVALLEQQGSRPEAVVDAEAALDRYLEKHNLKRNGLQFRLQPLSEGELPAVGVPIAPPPPETRPTTRPTTREHPRITVLPARAVFTTVIPGTDPAARSAAIERLLSRARAEGREPDGPCKIVLWSADIVQLQLPVRPKKG